MPPVTLVAGGIFFVFFGGVADGIAGMVDGAFADPY